MKKKTSIDILPGVQLQEDEAPIINILERNIPRLSEAEVAEISARVSKDLIEHWLSTLSHEKKTHWSERLQKLGYDIGIGLVSSGIWAALVYAASRIIMAAGPEKTERQARNRQRMEAIREKLVSGLSTEQFDEVYPVTEGIKNRFARHDQLVKRVLETDPFQGFIQVVYLDDKRAGFRRDGARFDNFAAGWYLGNLIDTLVDGVQDKIGVSSDTA